MAMEMIKRMAYGTFLQNSFIDKLLSFLSLKTFGLLAIALLVYSNIETTKFSPDFFQIKLESSDNKVQTINTLSSVELSKHEIEKLISEKRAFINAASGFKPEVFEKFRGYSKTELKEKLLKNIPKNLVKRAAAYIDAVLVIAKKHAIDPMWVLSIMWTESHFKPSSKSSVGAKGLMQLMPKTKVYIYNKYRSAGQWLLVEEDHFNMEDFVVTQLNTKQKKRIILNYANIELGVIYLKYLLKKFDHNYTFATVAYNMGPTWTRRRLRAKKPVGTKNQYLTKVERAYGRITTI